MRSTLFSPSPRRSLRRFAVRALAIVASISLVGGPSARAALLAGWDFQTTTNGGTAIAAVPSTQKVFVANFGSGTLYLDGSNGSSNWVSGTSASTTELNAFGGSATNTAGTSLSTVTTSPAALALVGGATTGPGAVAANGKFAVFTFNMSGYQDLVVSYASQRTATGFSAQIWDYSTDGLSWTPAQTITGLSTSFSSGSGGVTLNTITGLNNVTTAYLRLSGTGATASSGNNRFDNFQFNAATYTPPSGTATWTGDGSGGTWATGQQGHFAAPYAGDLGTTVLFTGVGETVTVSGAVQAGKVNFEPSSGSYTVAGGSSLELGVSTNVSVAAGSTATINTPLIGANGLTKGGTGTLVLGGANTFTGGVNISQGTVQVAADDALGDAANAVNVAGGTLKTTGNLTLGSGRGLTGAGTLDIAAGTTLTVAGSAGMTSASLPNSGTLDLQGSTRSLGAVTFGGASTITGAGSIAITGVAAGAVTSGTAAIGPGVTFGAGERSVDVGSGGTLLLDGQIDGGSGTRIIKTGAGTLVVPGTNNTGSFRIGVSAASPTNGGTVVLGSSASSGTAAQLQFNYGTLQTSTAATFPNGLSIGGRTGAAAVLGGTAAMTFSGSTSFFRGAGTSGEFRLDANNTTTISGTLGPTSGSGTASGVTIGGTGRLILAATSVTGGTTSFSDRVTVNAGATLEIANETVLATAPLNTSGGGTITFGVPAATVVSIQGTGTLGLKDTTNAPIVLTLSQTTSGTYAGGFSGPGSVVKNGATTLSLTGASTHTGTTSVLQGTLNVANGSALGASTLAVANSATTTIADYVIAGAGGLDLAADGLIDVTRGGMTVVSSSAADIVARIVEGRGDGSWNGTKGITSSAAAASGGDRTLGWLDNGDGTVTFAYAAAGDTNLDWQVDILDASNFLAGGKFDSGSPANWNEGDFTYDGFVDILDAASFLSNGLFDAGGYNSAPGQAGAVAAVPEPTITGAALLAAGAALLLVRRRRSTLKS